MLSLLLSFLTTVALFSVTPIFLYSLAVDLNSGKSSVSNSEHSSCPTYTLYQLLIYCPTNYCPNQMPV